MFNETENRSSEHGLQAPCERKAQKMRAPCHLNVQKSRAGNQRSSARPARKIVEEAMQNHSKKKNL
jgi:hypothetical protein